MAGLRPTAVRHEKCLLRRTELILFSSEGLKTHLGNKTGFLETRRLIRANLMHRKDATRLKTHCLPPLDSRQLQLNFTMTSTGQPCAKHGHDGR